MRASVVLVAAILSGSSLSAEAAVVTVTYTGTVVTGFDQTGLFGTPNGTLDGLAYIAVYQFDTTKGTYVSSADQTFIQGGQSTGNASPAITSYIEINGLKQFVSGTYNGSLAYTAQFGQDANTNDFQTYPIYSNQNLDNGIQSTSGGIPNSINQPYTYTAQLGDVVSGNYSNVVEDYSNNVVYTNTTAILSPMTVAETVAVGGIPEPSTWVMMLLGFGSLGMLAAGKSLKPKFN